jgi:hypothetical protein
MADCGFPLPCDSTISSNIVALKIINEGEGGVIKAESKGFGTAIEAEGIEAPGMTTRSFNGTGIVANSDNDDGVRALSASKRGVFGSSGNLSGFSAEPSGVWGDSRTGFGVVGSSTSNVGVMGRSDTRTGVTGNGLNSGVVGNGITGVMGNGNVGVMGNINSLRLGAGVVGNAGGTNSIGIVGNAGGFLSLAGLFDGNVRITGNLTKGGGGFKIDHPLDSANKYLNHSFVESPEMKNLYDGIAILDNKGETSVELPEYFESLNRDFCYQLTSIGASAPNLYIAEEVSHNRFKIAGGKPGMRVSWQVTGIRHDRWAEANPLIVEEEKPENQQGYYLHPEIYGQPEERGVEWAVNPELMRQMKEEQRNQTSMEN